jgi:polyhydroxyalkanoate synthase
MANVGTQTDSARIVGTNVELLREFATIAAGRSSVEPRSDDRRFSDPQWTTNPIFRRVKQNYLVASRAADRAVGGLERVVGVKRAEPARFATNLLVSAVSPTNFLVGNPAAMRRAVQTRGRSLARGTRNLIHDVRHNGGFPSMVDPEAFKVGRDLAMTPGSVVARDDFAEVIQYTPTTKTVFRRPVLIVPPPIGRFYFLDLRPGRSFVEYSVAQGFQTFMVSWRNPTPEQRAWDLDTYAARVRRALDQVRAITGAKDVDVVAFCAGGIITTAVLNHLAEIGDEAVHTVSYAVTLLDFAESAPISAFSIPALIAFARRRSLREGTITSRQMGSAFTLMRPDDLLFNYWINNYLMGDTPPAFDVLAWNADGTNLPGALHAQFLDIFRHNIFATPGGMTVLGTPLDLKRITTPKFVVGAISDHLTPWTGCYRTTQLLGGDSTFVLSYSGHIASLVNPPGNPKAHHWVGGEPGPDPEEWRKDATRQQGSWWEPWAEWLTARAGRRVAAPAELGSVVHPPLDPAPGMYVRDLEPA